MIEKIIKREATEVTFAYKSIICEVLRKLLKFAWSIIFNFIYSSFDLK